VQDRALASAGENRLSPRVISGLDKLLSFRLRRKTEFGLQTPAKK